MKSNCVLEAVLKHGKDIETNGYPFSYQVLIEPQYGQYYHVVIYRTLFKTKFKIYSGRYDNYFNNTPVMIETYPLNAWKQVKAAYKAKWDKIWEDRKRVKLKRTEEAKKFFCKD